ncbi:polysaccharide deacetylase family protein [Roseisolibacter sp. H3M3-2]|nr:polysaccharide deacetylase family protein [Roseisolibacter sp. H3M3-2]
MRLLSLLYHDVVGAEGFAGSGPQGGDADVYKLPRDAFAAHVAAVAAVASPPAVPLEAVAAGEGPPAVVFTFDDGGVGGYHHAAPVLEAAGWRGCFLVTTDWIGTAGFMDAAQLRELHARGHVIGSHSCSHPARISALPDARLAAEWRDSVARLEEVLAQPVRVASVPGGFLSDRVAAHAFDAGVRLLFTSEPTATVRRRGDRALAGRFSIMRGDPPAKARAFAADARLPQVRQAAYWNAKKVLKRLGGEQWLRLRRRLLRDA